MPRVRQNSLRSCLRPALQCHKKVMVSRHRANLQSTLHSALPSITRYQPLASQTPRHIGQLHPGLLRAHHTGPVYTYHLRCKFGALNLEQLAMQEIRAQGIVWLTRAGSVIEAIWAAGAYLEAIGAYRGLSRAWGFGGVSDNHRPRGEPKIPRARLQYVAIGHDS